MKPILIPALLFAATLFLPGQSQGQATGSIHTTTQNQEAKMATNQTNTDKVRALYEQVLNKRNMALLPDLVSGDYAGPQGERGPAGLEATVAPLIRAFPDIQWTIEDLFGDADRVAVRWKWQGTHEAPFRGFSPTHKAVTNTAIAIYRFREGKIISADVQTDRVGFLQAMGALPADLNALTGKGPGAGK